MEQRRRSKVQEIRTLIVRLALVAALVLGGFLAYKAWKGFSADKGFVIDDTPLHVEQIREIVELNTVKFRDEVVVDTVEYYKSPSEQIIGNISKLKDPKQIKHGITGSNIERRLTVIMKGELLYGVDLKTRELIVIPKEDKLIIKIPRPGLLSISLTPENTEVFVENGLWKDYERQALQRKARKKMIASGERLGLKEKAKAPLEKLLKQLIVTDKQIVIEYY